MQLLPGVDARDVHPHLWLFLGALAAEHRRITGEELLVTSLRRPPTVTPSWHSPAAPALVAAADLRRWALDKHRESIRFCHLVKQRYGRELGVVLEPEWLTDRERRNRLARVDFGPHIHVQLKLSEVPRTL